MCVQKKGSTSRETTVLDSAEDKLATSPQENPFIYRCTNSHAATVLCPYQFALRKALARTETKRHHKCTQKTPPLSSHWNQGINARAYLAEKPIDKKTSVFETQHHHLKLNWKKKLDHFYVHISFQTNNSLPTLLWQSNSLKWQANMWHLASV